MNGRKRAILISHGPPRVSLSAAVTLRPSPFLPRLPRLPTGHRGCSDSGGASYGNASWQNTRPWPLSITSPLKFSLPCFFKPSSGGSLEVKTQKNVLFGFMIVRLLSSHVKHFVKFKGFLQLQNMLVCYMKNGENERKPMPTYFHRGSIPLWVLPSAYTIFYFLGLYPLSTPSNRGRSRISAQTKVIYQCEHPYFGVGEF
jgi:hypothetical protein